MVHAAVDGGGPAMQFLHVRVVGGFGDGASVLEKRGDGRAGTSKRNEAWLSQVQGWAQAAQNPGEAPAVGRKPDDVRRVSIADPERFAVFAVQAVENAIAFRSLERRSFRDPTTRAYTRAYFEDVVRNEIQKAGRFGHRFSLIHVQLDGLAEYRRTRSETDFSAWLASLAQAVGGALRSTDLLATLEVDRTAILLPETDGLGAAVLKQRVREAVDRVAFRDDFPVAADRPVILRWDPSSRPISILVLEESGRMAGMSRATAYRHWSYARAWLKRYLDRESGQESDAEEGAEEKS